MEIASRHLAAHILLFYSTHLAVFGLWLVNRQHSIRTKTNMFKHLRDISELRLVLVLQKLPSYFHELTTHHRMDCH